MMFEWFITPLLLSPIKILTIVLLLYFLFDVCIVLLLQHFKPVVDEGFTPVKLLERLERHTEEYEASQAVLREEIDEFDKEHQILKVLKEGDSTCEETVRRYADVQLWLDENASGSYTFLTMDNLIVSKIMFDEDEDAVAFKLRWG